MHLAVMSGSENLVIWLLATKKSSLEKIDKKGETPLHTALIEKNLKIFKTMLDSKNRADLSLRDRDGRTVLDLLIRFHPELKFLEGKKIKRAQLSKMIGNLVDKK